MVPYVEMFKNCGNLPIKKIVIGPSSSQESRKQSLEAYLAARGLTHIEISCSGIPYKGI